MSRIKHFLLTLASNT